MPFGILIHLVRVLQHGTANLLQVNLKNIVFMNQRLEHVQVFIEDDKFALWDKIQIYKNKPFIIVFTQDGYYT